VVRVIRVKTGAITSLFLNFPTFTNPEYKFIGNRIYKSSFSDASCRFIYRKIYMKRKRTNIYDDPNSPAFKMAFEAGLTMPIKVLAILWGRDITTVTKMARLGRIPGAYRKGSDWWFYPKELTTPEPSQSMKYSTVFSGTNKPIQPRKDRR
jgi:hypothetical protein